MSEVPASSSTLAEVAARTTESFRCEANLPLQLNDPEDSWFIEQGAVNVFLIESKDGVEQAPPQHVLRREAGELLPNVAADEPAEGSSLSLVARGLPGTALKAISKESLREVEPAELATQLDSWVLRISQSLSRFVTQFPRATELAIPGTSRSFGPCTLGVMRGVVWTSEPPVGASLYMDMVDQAEVMAANDLSACLLPLSRFSWLSLFDETALEFKSTEMLIREGGLNDALASARIVGYTLERLNRQLAVVDEANLERARTSSRRHAEKVSRERLFNIYDQPLDHDSHVEERSLMAALKLVGHHHRLEFESPTRAGPTDAPLTLVDVLDTSDVRARRVDLQHAGRWWHGDSHALLAFREEDGHPVALLPSAFGRYREVDPVNNRSKLVTKRRAAALKPNAWMFYPALPHAGASEADLVGTAMKGTLPDIVRLVFSGLAGGLIKLLPAFALGYIANHIAMGGNTGVIYNIAFTLAAFGVVGAILHLLQNAALRRIEARSSTHTEAAFWDRLMRLPTRILQKYSAGDLAMAGMTFQNLRDGFQGAVADSLVSVMFLLPIFGVIFLYDATLGTVALGFSALSILVTVVLGLLQIPHSGRVLSATRHVSSRLFQIVSGVSKLRVENAEGSAFDIWARAYRDQKRAELDLGRLEGFSHAFGVALPLIAAGVLLVTVATVGERQTPVADFLVVYIVFMTFQSAITKLNDSFGPIAATVPTIKQMRPILNNETESDVGREAVEFLGGNILFDRVSFRFDVDGPLILDDVTIEAHPGEFVAIAGESGAGKSTLFRLALGFDTPTAGAVYYDGRDLRHLNLKQLRRHIGAVPQSVGLHPQDLWDNLVSHHNQPEIEDVWQAVRIAEMESQIKAMPMGLMTMVGTSGSVLSGGESQRVTIARSIMGNPRIMLFDEATNWLDNENQAEVMENLTALTSTRIVIAHRLSTLEKADRIYVLKAGKVVQSGTFGDLMSVDGVFSDLVKRQLV